MRLSGGSADTCEIVVRIVADLAPAPDPARSKVTTLFGKFVATTWSTCGQMDVIHWALRVSSIRSIALALAARKSPALSAEVAQKVYPVTIPPMAMPAMANDMTTSISVIPT